MPTFRPAVNKDDGYFKKVVKYIPAEVIAAYTFCIGLISTTDCAQKTPLMPWIFFGLLILTPVYMYISVIDNPTIIDPVNKKKQAIFHSIIALLAYMVWTYALADIPLICYFDKIVFNTITGSLILVAFSMIVPLLERLFLGKP
jgi:hypothetical protein